MSVRTLVEQFRRHSDEELLRLLLVPNQLPADALAALQAELASRGIDDPKIEKFLLEEQNRQEKESQEAKFEALQGIAKRYVRFGEADKTADPDGDREQYTTTFFFHVGDFPVAPFGSYRVERKNSSSSQEITVLEKVPFNWRQAWPICLAAAVTVLLLGWGLRLFGQFFIWASH